MDMATYPVVRRVYSWDLYRESLGQQWGFAERLSNRQGILYM